MNRTDIYRQAIKRTFADLYSVARHEIDVSWNKDGDNITVRCADKTFTHETIRMMMMTTARSNSSPPMKTPSPSD